MSSFLETLADNSSVFVDGFRNTVMLFVLAACGALVWGLLLAIFRISPVPPLRAFGTAYVNVVRNTPLTLVFFFVVFGFPYLQVNLSFFVFAVVALTMYTSAFVCETIRSGINTVAPGQAEAARALGFTFTLTLRYVVLPQAIRSVVPPLVSVLNALLKNTTIAAGFSVAEAGSIRAVLSERGYPVLAGLIWVVLGFIVLVLPLALAQRRLEARWRVVR